MVIYTSCRREKREERFKKEKIKNFKKVRKNA